MVLGRPQRVKARIGGEPRQPDLLVPHLIVADVLPAIAGEDHHQADIHGLPPHCSRWVQVFHARRSHDNLWPPDRS